MQFMPRCPIQQVAGESEAQFVNSGGYRVEVEPSVSRARSRLTSSATTPQCSYRAGESPKAATKAYRFGRACLVLMPARRCRRRGGERRRHEGKYGIRCESETRGARKCRRRRRIEMTIASGTNKTNFGIKVGSGSDVSTRRIGSRCRAPKRYSGRPFVKSQAEFWRRADLVGAAGSFA